MATTAAGSGGGCVGSGGGGGGGGGSCGKRWWGAAVAVGSGSSSSKHEARPRKKKEARSGELPGYAGARTPNLHTSSSAATSSPAQSLWMGIRSNREIRFGFSVFLKIRSSKSQDRSVSNKTQDRTNRSSVSSVRSQTELTVTYV
uniref:Uncharacterized protein n=1 Tax=Oryza sativa subsp. japonica TaxID=39947 RepID=Q6K6F4_ORYSJ|nr:hypothetical protein [Oryza sativa Japonica Group]